jgi:hypothetical protein
VSRRRVSWQQRDREFQREVAEQRARRAYLAEREAFGAFIMEADEHRLALIEQFGATAVRGQLAENREAYRKETERWQQQQARETFALALRCAQKRPAVRGRVVLYSEERGWRWSGGRTPLGDPCMNREYGPAFGTRHKRAIAELAKLGIPVEYVNPNE